MEDYHRTAMNPVMKGRVRAALRNLFKIESAPVFALVGKKAQADQSGGAAS